MTLPSAPEPITHIIHPELRAAIGAVAHEWAMLERTVDGTIWILARLEASAGACITAQLPTMSRKLDAVAALCWLTDRDPKRIADLRSFHEKSHSLSRKRNRIIHDTWTLGTETNTHYRLEMTADKRLKFEFKATELKEIYDFASEILQFRAKYGDIETKLLHGFYAWHETHPPAILGLDPPNPYPPTMQTNAGQTHNGPHLASRALSQLRSLLSRARQTLSRRL